MPRKPVGFLGKPGFFCAGGRLSSGARVTQCGRVEGSGGDVASVERSRLFSYAHVCTEWCFLGNVFYPYIYMLSHMKTVSSAQIDICRRFNSEVILSRAEHKLGIALDSLALLPLNALRLPEKNGTCGWYIWGGEAMSEAPDFFQPLHVLHLQNYAPSLLPYLALAPGWRVLLAPGYEDVWFDETLLNAHANQANQPA